MAAPVFVTYKPSVYTKAVFEQPVSLQPLMHYQDAAVLHGDKKKKKRKTDWLVRGSSDSKMNDEKHLDGGFT